MLVLATCTNITIKSCSKLLLATSSYPFLLFWLYFIVGPITVTRDYILHTIPVLYKTWSLSLEIRPVATVTHWSNIIRIGLGVHDQAAYGDRAPAIFFFPGSTKLQIASAVNHDISYDVCSKNALGIDGWTTLVVSQFQSVTNDLIQFRVTVGGLVIEDCLNTYPKEFQNVKVSSS